MRAAGDARFNTFQTFSSPLTKLALDTSGLV